MSDQDAARAQALWDSLKCDEDPVPAIAAALRVERARVWEQAVKHCRSDACGIEYKDPLMKRMAEYFQYRADHEKFGPAWERNKQQA